MPPKRSAEVEELSKILGYTAQEGSKRGLKSLRDTLRSRQAKEAYAGIQLGIRVARVIDKIRERERRLNAPLIPEDPERVKRLMFLARKKPAASVISELTAKRRA